MALGFKDLRLAEEVAAEGGVTLPTAAALHRVYEIALADDELARFDWGGAAEVTRRDLYPTESPQEDTP
jgi:3-hydroxyisobutyrate dehydrogenase-like beta-hydroxyacid dehydrogenase